jgi:hypothetical protein
MQVIKKKCAKATVYKAWLDGLTGKHPKYVSSSFRFYIDIKANLMICQKGLCAYTEIRLDDDTVFAASAQWKKGKYVGDTEVQGQLDHWDASLKKTKGWDWDNFFLTHNSVNNSKLARPVHSFMKPDSTGYSPEKYLDYNYLLHEFTVSPSVKGLAKRTQIQDMINVLGLNYGSIKRIRAKELNEIFTDHKKGLKTKAQLRTSQFHTAFKMIKDKLP